MLTSWLHTQQCGSGAPLQFTAGLLLGRPLLPVGSELEAPPRRATDVASLRRGGQGEDSSKICHIHGNAEGKAGVPKAAAACRGELISQGPWKDMGGSQRTDTKRNDKNCPCCASSVPPSFSHRGI